MKKEAVSNFYIVNNKLRSTKNMEIFSQIKSIAIYEVIKIIDSIPLFFEDHMNRMRNSAKLSNIYIKKTDKQILDEIICLVEKNKCSNINVKLIWSMPNKQECFMVYFIRSEYPGAEVYENGAHTILFKGERAEPNIKTLKSSFREHVKSAMEKSNAYEALLIDQKGYITEGSRSNIFFLKNGEILTSPDENVLLGVTRQHVIKICNKLGIKVTEYSIHQDELNNIKAAFITGTTVDVLPIASIGHKKISSVSHPKIQQIITEYKKEVKAYINSRK